MKTDNLTGKQDETSSNRQQELEPSTSQLKSSTFASLTVDNEHSDELSPSEDRMSNDQPRRAANVKENLQFLSNKFDFGDRDEKPTYNFTLPPLKENKGKEWTIDELKILHSCINSYGINDNCLFYATKNIPNRSMLDIREKISGIRELARLRQEMRAETRKNEWLKEVIVPSKTSEIQNWSSAIQAIQTRKRRITDYTDSALLDYFGQEVKCRPASVDTRKYFRVTDSLSGRAANRRQVVDCADYYRFLQACLSGTTCGCKPFDAAIILNILEEIQKEVDDPKYEEKRRILAGMFRDIQSGDLSDYDFRNAGVGSDDVLCVQLNPLILMRDMLEMDDK